MMSRGASAEPGRSTTNALIAWPSASSAHADHGAARDVRQPMDRVLDLARRHLLAARLDDVVLAGDVVQVAVGVGAEEVARVQHHFAGNRPGLQALRGLGRPLPVPAHHVTAADDQFPGRAVGQATALLIDQPVLLVRHAAPDAGRPGRRCPRAAGKLIRLHSVIPYIEYSRACGNAAHSRRRCGSGSAAAALVSKRSEPRSKRDRSLTPSIAANRLGTPGNTVTRSRSSDSSSFTGKHGEPLEHHGRAETEAHQQVVQAVAERRRQRQSDDVRLAQAQVLLHRVPGAEHVQVRQHHALRRARRAGGVDDGRQVLVDARRRHGRRRSIVARPGRHARRRTVAGAGPATRTLASCAASATTLVHAGRQLRLRHERPRPRVGRDEGEPLRLGQRVNRHEHAADHETGVHGHGVLDAAFEEHEHPVAGRDAVAAQCVRQCTRLRATGRRR